jgi:hypothetical protein
MAKNVGQIAGNVVAVVQGGQGVVQTAMADKVKGAALIACVGVPFKDAHVVQASRLQPCPGPQALGCVR